MAPIALSAIDSRSGLTSALSSFAKRLPTSLSERSATSAQSQSHSVFRHALSPRSISASLERLIGRQTTKDPTIIPTAYGSVNSGPSPGTVVGIVLGSVGGFLLILWLIYTCLNFGTWGAAESAYTESVVRDRRKSHHGSTRSRRVSETVKVRRAPSRSPIRIVRDPPPPARVIVEESRETRRERSRGGSDEVVVIEEHSPPRRQKSRRESGGRRDEGGYRSVDPLAYGGVVGGPSRKSSRRSSGR